MNMLKVAHHLGKTWLVVPGGVAVALDVITAAKIGQQPDGVALGMTYADGTTDTIIFDAVHHTAAGFVQMLIDANPEPRIMLRRGKDDFADFPDVYDVVA